MTTAFPDALCEQCVDLRLEGIECRAAPGPGTLGRTAAPHGPAYRLRVYAELLGDILLAYPLLYQVLYYHEASLLEHLGGSSCLVAEQHTEDSG